MLITPEVESWVNLYHEDFEGAADAMTPADMELLAWRLDRLAAAAALRSAYLYARKTEEHRRACRRANTIYRRVRRIFGYDPVDPLAT